MMKRIALAGLLASIVLVAETIKIPVYPFKSRLDDPYYRGVLERMAKTPTWVNTAAGEYLAAQANINLPETLRVLALRVEFPEDDDPATWGTGRMDLEGFGTPSNGLSYDPPHDKAYFENQMLGLRNFYLLNSRGKLQLECDVYPGDPFKCYEVPHKMAYYGDTSNPDRGLVLFMRDALQAASEDSEIDFSRYSYIFGGDTFDMVVIFHAGSTIQTSFAYGYTSDLASATVGSTALEYYTGSPSINVNGVSISSASILPESPRVEGAMNGLPGVLYHEFGHLLGAYDLYDVTYYSQGVGAWALMGGGGWLSYPPGQIPSMHDAFHRYFWGWDSAVVVTRDTVLSLFASEMDTLMIPQMGGAAHPTLIKIPIRDGEYFLIENRQADILAKDTVELELKGGVPIWVVNGEYDAYQPGSGIIIWHIDEDVISKWGTYNRINAWSQLSAYGEHNAVDMEEADGIQDYEIPNLSTGSYASQGSKYDPFFLGGNPEFAVASVPSSSGYYGETGINIEVLDSPDTVMRVKITFGENLKGFPQTTSNPSSVNFINALDLDGNGTKELVAFVNGNAGGNHNVGFAWEADGSPYAEDSRFLSFSGSLTSSPAFGDVDGDGLPEAILLGQEGTLSVFDTDSLIGGAVASEKQGFPLSLEGRSFSSPMLADLDGDKILDILAVNEFGNIYAVKVESDSFEVLSGYPRDIGEEARPGFALVETSPVRIALLTTSGVLYLLDDAGKIVNGFPLELGQASAQCDVPPVAVDIDADGKREIMVFAYEYNAYRYFVVSQDGSVKYKSSRTFAAPVTAPAVADVNGDSLPEVVFGSLNGLWALEPDGSAASGFPVVFPDSYDEIVWVIHEGYIHPIDFLNTFEFHSSPVVADLDADGTMELAIGSPDHGVYLIKSGARKPYKTLYTRWGVGKALSLADLDNDTKLEILVGADSGQINVWEANAVTSAWPSWMHDPANTGLYSLSVKATVQPPVPLSSVYVYPNPAADHAYLRVELGDVDALKVQLIDIAGKIQGTLDPEFHPGMVNDIPLDEILPGLVPGLYIVRVEALSGSAKSVELYKLGVVR